MERIWNSIQGLKPAMMMVVVQTALGGVSVFYKLAANDGMNMTVLIAYRFLFASAFIVPLALLLERKSRPKLTWVVACQAFFCGLLGGSMAQNLYAQSLVLTSATFATAMINLVPAFTFILAISFRLERLGLGTMAGKAKLVGTLMCIGGAMLLTFYKGAVVNIWSTNVDLLRKGHHQGGHVASSHQEAIHHALGALLAVCCCFSTAVGLIVQAKMIRNYPCPYSSTALMIFLGAIQAVVFGLCMERDWNQWKLGWNIRLLTVSFSGIVASGIMYTFMAWVVQMRGPLFVSVFNPLMLVLVAIAGSLFLDESLHLGSVLGAVVIVCGLYIVLWGKGKELKIISQLMPSKSSRESECIEIITTSSSKENKNNSSNSSKTIGVASNAIALVCDDDALDKDISEKNNIKEREGGGGESSKLNINV